MPPSTIAIDGPAGAGKTAIGLWLADHLGYTFFDTGVLYRAATLVALRAGIPIGNGDAITDILTRTTIDVIPPTSDDVDRGYTVTIDGAPLTAELFTPVVNGAVSPVAAHASVRRALLPVQRRIGARGAVVMVGRDVGTTVLPHADLKIYLDASVDERAGRRWKQEQRSGGTRSLADVRADVVQRDTIDQSRDTSPLRAADDAHRIDTDNLSLDAEKEAILALVASVRG